MKRERVTKNRTYKPEKDKDKDKDTDKDTEIQSICTNVKRVPQGRKAI
ncbi:MAG: hypothetical protein K0S39_4796 [Paenibacillus sp.]|jgi:hypothetical protein|nr:hypothetical protein [Paenibacillus sp.]